MLTGTPEMSETVSATLSASTVILYFSCPASHWAFIVSNSSLSDLSVSLYSAAFSKFWAFTALSSAAFIIVAVRAYMGYGIPTAWRKTVIQTILLYVFMGTGKCLGGVLIDKLGIYKTAIISIAGSVPFLLFGNNIMEISLIGIMFFSMTMAITLAVLVSVIKECPGGAFGITTIGLFLGTFPTFVFRVDGFAVNCVIILIASVICLILALKILPREGK